MAGTDWDKLINNSLAQATPHTRSIFGQEGRVMSADELLDFFQDNRMGVMSTVSPSGVPHSTCVAFIIVDGRFYFRIGPETILNRNLKHKPRIAVAVVVPPFTVNILMQGSVRFLSATSEDWDRVRNAFRAKFAFDPEILAELIPVKVFALKQ